MSSDPELRSVPAEGSLGLLAYGYRGLVAWRAARGTAWLDAEREAAAEQIRQKRDARASTSPEAERPAKPLAEIELTVVSGLPRSGTSMLMQMLVSGGRTPFVDDAREADPSNPRGYYEHARVKALARDKSWVREADGHVVKVVAPLLPLLPLGPTYRVVLLTRSLDEVLRSQRRMLGRLGRPVADDAVLRSAYTHHLAAARRWAESQPNVHLLEVDHADVVADPAPEARAIAAFVGGDLDAEAMAAAVDPSLHRERA